MESVVKVRQCQWYHEPYYLSDGRYKYCSDECAEEAQRAHCRKKIRKKTHRKSCSPFSKKADDIYLEKAWLRFVEKYKKQCVQSAR